MSETLDGVINASKKILQVADSIKDLANAFEMTGNGKVSEELWQYRRTLLDTRLMIKDGLLKFVEEDNEILKAIKKLA